MVDAVGNILLLRERHRPADDAQRREQAVGANQNRCWRRPEIIVFSKTTMVLTKALPNSRQLCGLSLATDNIYSSMCSEYKDPDLR